MDESELHGILGEPKEPKTLEDIDFQLIDLKMEVGLLDERFKRLHLMIEDQWHEAVGLLKTITNCLLGLLGIAVFLLLYAIATGQISFG